MKFYLPFLALWFVVFTSCNQHPMADKIYFNARIWTGDSSMPAAEAIAIKDSFILYVGNDFHQYADGHTTLIDLDGKMLVPGFIDNHVHFLDGGYYLANIDLREAKSKFEFSGFALKFLD